MKNKVNFNWKLLLGIIILIGIIIYREHFLIFWNQYKCMIAKITLLFILIYPFKIGRDIYSVFWGINKNGSVYSLFGIFQIADRDARSLFGIMIYQQADWNACQILGISIYQRGGRNVWQLLGVSIYKKADEHTLQGFGVSCYQYAEKYSHHAVGLSIYQYGCKYVGTYVGMSIYQYSQKNTWQSFGLSIYQCAINECFTGFGINIVQISKINSQQYCSFSIYQSAMRLKANYSFSLVRKGSHISDDFSKSLMTIETE